MVTTDSTLEMHVFGASQGESIAIRTPTGNWGVVDCYTLGLHDPAENAICRFLADRKIDTLEFLCLTHPHDDHFRGMSHLLGRFHVRYFWRPSVMCGEKLKWILKLSHVDAKRSGDATTIENAGELERIFTLVCQRRRENGQPLLPKNASVATQLYPVPFDPQSGFQIWAIAPSGNQCDAYEESLQKCFDNDGRFKERLPYSRHNEISLALLVMFGDTRLILGGDVERGGWNHTLKEFGIEKLSATAVKVSHHGSTNGYCDGLWQGFAANGKPIAVVTPYRRHRLPRRDALRHIGKFAHRLATPCLAGIPSGKLPIPLSPHAPVKSRKALRDKLKATTDLPSLPTGRCSFIFDARGNCISEEVDPPAGEVPLEPVTD